MQFQQKTVKKLSTLIIILLTTLTLLVGCGGSPNSSATAYLNNEPKLIKLSEVGGLRWEAIEVFIDGESKGIAEFVIGSQGLNRKSSVLKRSFGPLKSEYGEITIDFVISSGEGLLGSSGADNYFDVKLNGEHWVVVDSYVK
tara:strand:+ start:195 stop:620 length:426 start_codon:yes stop_codon:yes gene_type:complete